MRARENLEAAHLRELMSYDPHTGVLVWHPRQGNEIFNSRFAGKVALDAPHKSGYRHGMVKGWPLLAHRVAWALHYGEWPDAEIDHINGDKADNRIANLRCVDRETNCKNKRVRADNTSGQVGVSYRGASGKWIAYVSAGGKQVFLGTFSSLKDAVNARKAAERENGYHENNGRMTEGGTVAFVCDPDLAKTVSGR